VAFALQLLLQTNQDCRFTCTTSLQNNGFNPHIHVLLGLKPFTRFMNGSYLGNIQFYFIILHHHPPLHLENPRLQYQGC
jgi:hypothetical protein